MIRPSVFLVSLAAASYVAADTVYIQSSDYNNGVYGVAPQQTFYSSPLQPVAFNIEVPVADNETLYPGYIFIAPRGGGLSQQGPQIFDNNGSLVWMGETQTLVFHATEYKGEPVLVHWEGQFNLAGYGSGYDIILDKSYNQIANFTIVGVDNTLADIHDCEITVNDTALMTGYNSVPYNLSAVGGPESSYILSGIAQELDIESNTALFTWHSIDHVDPSLCYSYASSSNSEDSPFDYFHINSIDKDHAGNYLISSRNCHAFYYVDGSSGDIIWSMGGKNSSFTMGNNTQFEWQHDARWQTNQTQISFFDNAASGDENDEATARGVIFDVDFDNMTVELNTEFIPYNKLTSNSQGSVQILEKGGNVLVDFGIQPDFSEYLSDGTLIYSVRFGQTGPQSYRAFRQEWHGYPNTLPSLSVFPNGTSNIFVSWNGATEVRSYGLYGSNDTSTTVFLANTTKAGFETSLYIPDGLPPYNTYQVSAHSADGTVLAFSDFTAYNGSTSDPTAEETASVVDISTITSTTTNSVTATATPGSSNNTSGASSLVSLGRWNGAGFVFASVAFGLFALL